MRPVHIGLTGNIASGKSAVARQLEELGATVIDADQLAREAVLPGSTGFDAVVAEFGPNVVLPSGELDRAAIRQRVFSNPRERDVLNGIVHPIVGRLRDVRFAEAAKRGVTVVISDIPLLFEVGLEHAFDGVLLVDAPASVRRERLVRDRGLSAADADAMIAAQWPSERKRTKATWVIDNDGSREQLHARVTSVWHAILELAGPRGTHAPVS